MGKYYFLWFLLIVEGVLGDDIMPVSVLVEDTVTLNSGITEVQISDEIVWKKDNIVIAKISEQQETLFRDGLKLDKQTGYLTFTNITLTDSGDYSVDIKRTVTKTNRFKITVSDKVKSVPVMEGDSVSVHTELTEKESGDHVIQWFGDQGNLIADLSGTVDKKWNKLILNKVTGDLNITDIQRNQAGVYKVEINSSKMILHRKFNITVGDGMKDVSRKEGETFFLRTGVIEIQGFDLILWKFGKDVIGEINKVADKSLVYDTKDKKFKGRLELNPQSGILTISDSKTTDSGDYHLQMRRNSTHTLQRNITVTVKDIPLGSFLTVLITAFVSVVATVLVCLFCVKCIKKKLNCV